MKLGRPIRWALVLVVVLLVAIAWRATREPRTLRELDGAHAPSGQIEATKLGDEGQPAAVAHAQQGAQRRATARELDRARRDALRERLLEREVQAIRRAANSAPHRSAVGEGVERPLGPGLTDRIGGRDALKAALDRDFLPLVDECIAAANEAGPPVAGMLAIELELLADPELGAIVESASFPDTNEIHHAELLDCVRETALSSSLPPPPAGGRAAFLISLPLGHDDLAAR